MKVYFNRYLVRITKIDLDLFDVGNSNIVKFNIKVGQIRTLEKASWFDSNMFYLYSKNDFCVLHNTEVSYTILRELPNHG